MDSPIGQILGLGGLSIVALSTSFLMLSVLLGTGLASKLATDIPNHRSLHARPIPRVGGWAIAPVAGVAALFASPWLSFSVFLLAVISYLDDRYRIAIGYRLAAHFAAVIVLLLVYPPPDRGWIIPLTLLFVWFINVYNFMDGADGLAGGMAVFGFGAFAYLARQAYPLLAALSAALSGSALGFLAFNFPPAKIFLGDSGSIVLGYLASAVGFLGWRAQVWPAWFPIIVFAPFIADASLTLMRRLIRGEKVWEAHCEHYFQRMIRMGWGQRATLLTWITVINIGITLAFCCLQMKAWARWTVITLWIALLLLLGLWIEYAWKAYDQAQKR